MKRILILAAALFTACTAFAQSEYNLQRRSLFEVLPVYSSDIVFLGNSITDGCEWAELFNNRHVKNRGISGDRSGWLLDRLDPIVGGHPKKLFLMIGVNDLAAGVSPDEIVANVARLIDRFQSESRWTKIYVQSILPVNGESFAKFKNHYEHGRQIVPLNKRLEALCDEKEVTYLDVWGGAGRPRGAAGQALHQRWPAPDGRGLRGVAGCDQATREVAACRCRIPYSGGFRALPTSRACRLSSSAAMCAITTCDGLRPTSTWWSWAAALRWPRRSRAN